MPRRITFLAVVALLIGVMAAPASADRPTVFGPFTNTFTDVDPCTGLLQAVTVTITFNDHEDHNNNFVGRAETTGTTDAGYVMIGGHDQFVANENGVRGSFKDVWRNADSGDKMQASSKLRIVGNAMVIDEFELRCVGGPTILP